MALAIHAAAFDDEHNGPTAALAHALGGFLIGRQMHVVPIAANEARLSDRIQKAFHGAVIKQFGRFDGLQIQIHFNAVPLVARISRPSDEMENRFLSFVATTSSKCCRVMDCFAVAAAANSSSIFTQPSGSSIVPIA